MPDRLHHRQSEGDFPLMSLPLDTSAGVDLPDASNERSFVFSPPESRRNRADDARMPFLHCTGTSTIAIDMDVEDACGINEPIDEPNMWPRRTIDKLQKLAGGTP